jgi:hypothetical protein
LELHQGTRCGQGSSYLLHLNDAGPELGQQAIKLLLQTLLPLPEGLPFLWGDGSGGQLTGEGAELFCH